MSEVFGKEHILDPEDKTGFIEKLIMFLENMKTNPGKPLLLVRTWREQIHRGIGHTGEAQFKTRMACVLFTNVSLTNIVYQAPNGETAKPYLAIRGDKAAIHVPQNLPYEIGVLVDMLDSEVGVIVGRKNSESSTQSEAPLFDLASGDVKVLYDPTLDKAMDVVEVGGVVIHSKIEQVLCSESDKSEN